MAVADYTFTGQRHDSYTQLVEMGARWHEGRIGRWVSADTIVPGPSNPQNLNRFSYVVGNPLAYVDPPGHAPCGLWCPGDLAPDPRYLGGGRWDQALDFTGEPGLRWDRTMKQPFYAAAYDTGRQFAAEYGGGVTPLSAFLRGMRGPVTIHRIGGGYLSGWAETCMDFDGALYDSQWNVTEVYCAEGRICYGPKIFATEPIGIRWRNIRLNAVHEFGHTFSQRRGRRPDHDLGAHWNSANPLPRRTDEGDFGGFYGPFGSWQQSRREKASEQFADMFLGWVFGRFHAGPNGTARSEWMSNSMPAWLGLSVDEAGS